MSHSLYNGFDKMSPFQLTEALKCAFHEIDAAPVDESAIRMLLEQSKLASAAADKLDKKLEKRKALDMLNTFSYGEPDSAEKQAEAIRVETFRLQEEKQNAIYFPPGSAAYESKLLEDAESLERQLKIRVYNEKQQVSMNVREMAMLDFFKEHSTKAVAKCADIKMTIPGYRPVIEDDRPTKKSKITPTTLAVQTAIGYAFREPDGEDKMALLARLTSQLQDTEKEAKRVNKRIQARIDKLEKRPVSKSERRYNNGIRKLGYPDCVPDNSDRYHSHWFEKHLLCIKDKIASVVV
jgi:hypothetical protein